MEPTSPAIVPNRKYSVPMSLWLVENSHRGTFDMGRWLIIGGGL